MLELFRRDDTADVRVKFAYELVAVAMVKNREASTHIVEEFTRAAFCFLPEAVARGTAQPHPGVEDLRAEPRPIGARQ